MGLALGDDADSFGQSLRALRMAFLAKALGTQQEEDAISALPPLRQVKVLRVDDDPPADVAQLCQIA